MGGLFVMRSRTLAAAPLPPRQHLVLHLKKVRNANSAARFALLKIDTEII